MRLMSRSFPLSALGDAWGTRWMDVSAYLQRESAGGKTVRQIIFAGERFDAVSPQNWRKKMLGR